MHSGHLSKTSENSKLIIMREIHVHVSTLTYLQKYYQRNIVLNETKGIMGPTGIGQIGYHRTMVMMF